MSKRNHTHIQVVLPEIKAMLAEGKAQREVASYYRFLKKSDGFVAAGAGFEPTACGLWAAVAFSICMAWGQHQLRCTWVVITRSSE